MPTPRISLCMIVRDEAERLEACLSSAAGAADEVIIVDTGSKDGTPELAERLGARVAVADWNNDFSAARNETLRYARGDYILWLDADERLAEGAPEALRHAIRDSTLDCGMLPLYPVQSTGQQVESFDLGSQPPPTLVARLARRTPDLRWQGRVHESWRDWLMVEGRRIARVNAAILHDGALPEVRDPARRQQRNTTLLELRANEEPDDVLSRAYLAIESLRLRQRARARGFAHAAFNIVSSQLQKSGRVEQAGAAVQAVTAYGWVAIGDGQYQEALDAASLLLQHGSKHPNLHWIAGLAQEIHSIHDPSSRVEMLRSAEAHYRRALDAEGRPQTQPVAPEACGGPLRCRLSTVLIRQGRPEDALRLLEHASTAAMKGHTARLLTAEALIDLARPGEALAALDGLLTETSADAWLLAAAAAHALDPSSARPLILRARGLAREHLREFHRLERLNALLVK